MRGWTPRSWSNGLPNPFQRTEIHGNSNVLLPVGTYLAGDLEIGLQGGDEARVEVDGGQLILMQDSLRLGEDSGGSGELLLKSGAIHCAMDVYVGAANSVPGKATKGSLTIQSGGFLGRTLLVGNGWAAESRVHIEGSQPTAIHFLDYVYIQALADPDGHPGTTTLAFTLDAHGVTPITIQSHRNGLRIVKDKNCGCRLEVALSDVPPRDDVTLVSGHVPIVGTFDDLPEGSEVTAQFAGHTYRWKLTYQGGESGHDLVLKNAGDYPADVPITHTRTIPEPPPPLWREHPLYPLAITPGEPAFPGAKVMAPTRLAAAAARPSTSTISTIQAPAVFAPPSRPPARAPSSFAPVASSNFIPRCESTNRLSLSTAKAPRALASCSATTASRFAPTTSYSATSVFASATMPSISKTCRAAEGGAGEHALYFIDGSKNCIADHLSLSWSTTKVLSVTKLSDLITVQWCILSEGLNYAGHGFASLAGGNRVTWHHNLFAHNVSRNVRFQGLVDADFRNNVVYDWGHTAAYGEFDRVNFVGNYYKAGPSTTQKPWLLFHDGGAVVMPGSLYVANNIMDGELNATRATADNWRGMGYYYERDVVAAKEPLPAPPIESESPDAAYKSVLAGAGATLPKRDAVDARIIDEVEHRSGHLVNSVADAGGWPDFPSADPTAKQPQENTR